MKILSVSQIREADAFTIANEPVASVDLMVRAASKCFQWIKLNFGKQKTYKIFCGTGNNGGDGLVIARLMAEKNMKAETFVVRFSDKTTGDFDENYKRLKRFSKIKISDIKTLEDIPQIDGHDIVIDSIFGSGLSKPVSEGIVAELIKKINKSPASVIAIDIPSGLFGDDNRNNTGEIICASHTLTFQFPKLAFMFAQSEKFTGIWHVIPIGLHSDFIKNAGVNNYYVEAADCTGMIKTRKKFSHKGTYGHALMVCGQYGMMGAAVLASRSCIRAGAGLVTAHIPACGTEIMQIAAPEILCRPDAETGYINEILDVSGFNAICVGPGIGKNNGTQSVLKMLIQNSANAMVIDADALNILSENKTWISFVPKNSILTPHPKEFERLVGKSENEYQRQEIQIEFSKKNGVYVILKGAQSCISTPAGDCYFNSTGNPGMATAGSGDVLSGIITGLLSQGYTSFEASILGVFVHGLSGDLAAKQLGYEALTADDIIIYLGKAFKKIHS